MKQNLRTTLGLLIFLSASAVNASNISITDRWIREAPPGAKAMGGFMKLENHSKTDRYLVAARSPVCKKVELHKTISEGGMSKMVLQPEVRIPSSGKVFFKPMGYHLMLIKPKHFLKAGDKVPVTLIFNNGEEQQLTYLVKASTMQKEGQHNHMHH